MDLEAMGRDEGTIPIPMPILTPIIKEEAIPVTS